MSDLLGFDSGGFTDNVYGFSLPKVNINNIGVANSSNNLYYGLSVGVPSTTPLNNIAFGRNSLKALTTGSQNTCIGLLNMSYATNASNCVAVGYKALWGVATLAVPGNGGNCGIGANAGERINTGLNNTCIGTFSGQFLSTGSANTFVGNRIAYTGVLKTGSNNVVVGANSFTNVTSAAGNTIIGQACGSSMSSGSDNVIIGRVSGTALTSANNTILIGRDAGTSSSPFTATIDSSNINLNCSNSIVLGNNNITRACIKVAWTVTSDMRDKTDIEPLDPDQFGLSYIMGLQPVSFRFNDRSRYCFTDENGVEVKLENNGSLKDSELRMGFLAQQVEDVERVNQCNPLLSIVSKTSGSNLGLKESFLIPIIINALQEAGELASQAKTRALNSQTELTLLKEELRLAKEELSLFKQEVYTRWSSQNGQNMY